MMGAPAVTFECVVDADLFRRAQLAVSVDETRYYLNGVFVEPCKTGGALVVATDGAMLLAFRDPNGHVKGSAIISLDKPMLGALKAPRGALGARLLAIRLNKQRLGRALLVDSAGEKGSAQEVGLAALEDAGKGVATAQFRDIAIDGKYPNWRGVVPTAVRSGGVVPGFDAKRLETLAKALCPKDSRAVCVAMTGGADTKSEEHPLIVTPERGLIDGFGILMPVRGEAAARPAPRWAEAPAPKAEAA
jgi:hypothetical protein